ncbi:class I SAM-dependent methyltransferase [Mesorhizobium carmichaelinearum]|uniref:class I SAM-dependent methyltransferase n=1 Tax=Mesorhizobium carmichaelinearum TaxID=1208188 RepID=UPI00117E2166|nr:class I SAM-dependent methyltransferase [Mesorhizobium carmichaelinearum]
MQDKLRAEVPQMLTADQAVGMIGTLDIAVFQVQTQSTFNDRASFLRVQTLARSALGRYIYLEVGSHIGGSLFPHLIDPACQGAVSVDPRPAALPDERAEFMRYPENSTARMIAVLSERLPPSAMAKLTTFDSDVSAVPPGAVEPKATLAFIDGEHTNRACFSDFAGVLQLTKPDCIISFHDANLIADAIINAERFLDHLGVAHETVFLPDTVAVMGLGRLASAVRDELQPHGLDRVAFLERSQRELWSHIAKVHSREIRTEVERLRSDNARLAEEIERTRKAGRLDARMSRMARRASARIRKVVDRIKRRFAR